VLFLDDLDLVVAGVVVPLGEFLQDQFGIRGQLQYGCAQVVVDVHVFVVEGVGGVRQLLLVLLSIPLLQYIDEEVKLFVLLEERVCVELTQLEPRVGLILEQLLDVLLQSRVAATIDNGLQGGTHYSIEYNIPNELGSFFAWPSLPCFYYWLLYLFTYCMQAETL